MNPETAWLSALRAGEPAAFERVYAAYGRRIYGFLLRMVSRRDVAEELLQDCFLRLARHAPRLREDTDLGAWLFTVARNLARSWRRWSWLDGARLAALAGVKPPPPPDPAALAGAGQTALRLEAAIAELPPLHREALLLVAVDGLEPAQAAAVLDITPEALRQRLARARATLRTTLGDAP